MKTQPRVLVVDDEPDIRSLIVRVLEADRFVVTSTGDGREALALINKQNFDLIVTDVRMPHVSGIDVLRAVKKVSPSTEVVIITGFGTIEAAEEAVRLGAYDYLSKPLPNIKDVVRIAKQAIDKEASSKI